mmetsp:Transcript_127894/g.303773  ORF Transcript_127894/g.303773 Transcript_127894/m.303773 type:complete len:200 (-) Transcript_127894:184-783(-)
MRGRDEGQVLPSLTRRLEAKRSFANWAGLRDKVHAVCLLAFVGGNHSHLTARSPGCLGLVWVEGHVQPAGAACRGCSLVAARFGSQAADAAHVVHLGQPPKRELAAQEEGLEVGIRGVPSAVNHHSAAQASHEAFRMTHWLHHELLRHPNAWSRARLQGPLALLGCCALQVVSFALQRIGHGLIGNVQQPDLLLGRLAV